MVIISVGKGESGPGLILWPVEDVLPDFGGPKSRSRHYDRRVFRVSQLGATSKGPNRLCLY